MAGEPLPVDDPAALAAALAGAASRADTVEAFAAWLRGQPAVEAVTIAPHLVKTEPPQQEVTARFRRSGGATVSRTIDIVVHPDGTLALGGIHEP